MTNIPIETAKSITEVLTCFDFEKVAEILQCMDVHIDSEDRGPDVLVSTQDVKDRADKLIWELIEAWDKNDRPEDWTIGPSGPCKLQASIYKGKVSLSFIPEEWRTDY